MNFGKQRYEAKYLTIKYFNEEKKWNIGRMCKLLKVSRAGYYKWIHRQVPIQERENEDLAVLVMSYYERVNGVYGYRQITDLINKTNGTHYSDKKIYVIMKKLNIQSVVRKKKKGTKPSTPEMISENILARNFNASMPNEKWCGDVTELPIPNSKKKLYLSGIIDLYDRYPVAFVLSKRNDNLLVFKTLNSALNENPEAHPLFHSDRGFQYTSKTFGKMLSEQGITHSMSRVGRCIDNAPIECFWGILKSEIYHLYDISDEETLIHAINDYIKYYCEERPQRRFIGKTPKEVREAALFSDKPIQYAIAKNPRIEKYKSKWNKKETVTQSA